MKDLYTMTDIKKPRGRPRKNPLTAASVQTQVSEKIVEVVREIIKTVPEPRLEGFELYKMLKDKGYFQGGMGQYMEDPNGTERIYIPTYQEVITYFIGDPDKMDAMRDAIIRAYIELT